MSVWTRYDICIQHSLILELERLRRNVQHLAIAFILQLTNKLKGHSKRISSLSFSTVLNVLVSSGLDAQVGILYILLVDRAEGQPDSSFECESINVFKYNNLFTSLNELRLSNIYYLDAIGLLGKENCIVLDCMN